MQIKKVSCLAALMFICVSVLFSAVEYSNALALSAQPSPVPYVALESVTLPKNWGVTGFPSSANVTYTPHYGFVDVDAGWWSEIWIFLNSTPSGISATWPIVDGVWSETRYKETVKWINPSIPGKYTVNLHLDGESGENWYSSVPYYRSFNFTVYSSGLTFTQYQSLFPNIASAGTTVRGRFSGKSIDTKGNFQNMYISVQVYNSNGRSVSDGIINNNPFSAPFEMQDIPLWTVPDNDSSEAYYVLITAKSVLGSITIGKEKIENKIKVIN